MKNKMNKDYSQPVILSELNLKDNDFSDTWIMGFFLNPVVENLSISDENKKNVSTNLYLNFAEIEVPNGKGSEFYKKLHLEMKKYIIQDWKGFGDVKPIYGFHSINRDNKKVKSFLFIFLSPNKPNKVFDFKLIYSKEKLITNIFELLLKAYILDKSNILNPISFDVVSGKIFIEPQIQKKGDGDIEDDSESKEKKTKNKKKNVSVFSFKLDFNNFMLNFGISLERYLLEESKDDLDIYEDFCSINNYKYGRKKDAREQSRVFFSFKNFESLKYSKFAAQVKLYKNILEMLDKYKITYEKTRFAPEYIYCDFPKVEVDIKKVNVYINSIELENYNNYLKTFAIKQSFDDFISYFSTEFDVKLNIFVNSSFDKIYQTKNEYNLFLMFGEQYQDNYVSYKEDGSGKIENWDSPILPFIEKELYKLDEKSLIKVLSGFDLYSQIKIYNLYVNRNRSFGSPFISQGLFLNDLKLKVEKTTSQKNKSLVTDDDNVTASPNKKVIFSSSFEILAKKVINELNTKHNLYVKKEFNFKNSFEGLNDVTEFKKVKIMNVYPKKNLKIYSYVDLIGNKNGLFKVDSYGLLFEDDIKGLNLDFDINKEFNMSDSLIIIDDDYLVKVKDNSLMPIMIMEESKFNVPDKDPILMMQNAIDKDNSISESPNKSNAIAVNSCFPYNIPAVSSMVIEKKKTMVGNHSAMLDFSNEELKVFMTLSTHGVKQTIPKNNRLESIQLFKLKDFSFEKQNWLNNEQILNFYLSSIPFDYMISNAITKKSLLNKLADVVMLN